MQMFNQENNQETPSSWLYWVVAITFIVGFFALAALPA